MIYEIESTSFCPNGLLPRWTWWIRGIAGTGRYGIVGTDEAGEGLYLYIYSGDEKPTRSMLLDSTSFSLSEQRHKSEALQQLTSALHDLGWGALHPESFARAI